MSIRATCTHSGKSYTLDDALAGRKAKCKVCHQVFQIPAVRPKPAEVSAGGVPIYRHPKERPTPAPEVPSVTKYDKQITRHIERTIGPAPMVFHEIVSHDIHLDLHIVPPTNQEPSEEHPLGTHHYTIVTSGLSARPQNVSPEARENVSPYQELMIALPGDWPGMNPDGTFDRDAIKDDRNWWPFAFLKLVARMPHEYETFLAPGVTIPNGEKAEPFAKNTKLGCVMTFPSILSPQSKELQITDHLTIQFYALWPLYPEEMQLKLDKGLSPLLDKLIEAEMSELIQIDRPNTCKTKGWFGR
jgi:hypothetical protein